jgi:hypothetical protein
VSLLATKIVHQDVLQVAHQAPIGSVNLPRLFSDGCPKTPEGSYISIGGRQG